MSAIVKIAKTRTNLARCVSKMIRKNYSQPTPLTMLTPDELQMKEQVAKVVAETVAPYVKKMEKEEKFDQRVIDSLFSNGIMSMCIPSRYNGADLSFMMVIQAIEEVAKVDSSVSVLVAIHNTLISGFINKMGTDEQKQRYLPELASSKIGSFCLTEPSSGSDAFALKTRAKLEGDYYLLNGTKMWISNSDIADVFVVFANVNPEMGYKGITCFIVDRDNPGLTIGKKEDKMGIKASGTCMLHFDNCKVPITNVLGEVGKGYKYAIGHLNEGRVSIATQMLGIAEGSLNATIPYMFERKQFNQSIFSFQAVQHKIAQLYVELEAARLLTYNAARLVENNQPHIKEAAMAKYYASEMAGRITTACIDLMGGVGYTTDFPQEKYFRDAKIGTIYEGSSNLMLNRIASEIKKNYDN